MDRNGNIDPKPALVEFVVTLPWYKEIRLVLIALAGAAVALFFAALAFNRHRQLLRSYAQVEQKVAERTRQLELANRELLHSQKMNALGTLAAGIAHDFNNILSIIKGSAQIIEDNPDKPKKSAPAPTRIKTVVEQGAGIVNAMLGFSRGAGEPALPCDLNAVVRTRVGCWETVFCMRPRWFSIRLPACPNWPFRKDFVQQILLNFIFNAGEAMTGRKRIDLATRQTEKLPPEIYLPPAAAPRLF